jgi:hypothetical protein
MMQASATSPWMARHCRVMNSNAISVMSQSFTQQNARHSEKHRDEELALRVCATN